MFITQAELKVLVHVCKNSTALCSKSGSHTHKKKTSGGTHHGITTNAYCTGARLFYGKAPHPLLRVGSQAVRGKITIMVHLSA